ncbi:hypothetical protein VQ643_14820 [Pseudomonas sp. F1_0610]|uniref:hypothetical protein n=1 Tax=Pseudomonas sp. F1_0610 TaxID=3114284 RepID=UPI0039C237DC
MKNYFQHYTTCIFIFFLLGFTELAQSAPLAHLEFKPDLLTTQEQQQICHQLQTLCTNQSKWRSIRTTNQTIWLLFDNHIALFIASPNGLKLSQQWSIEQADNNSEDYVDISYFIYPKLFVMDEHRYAVTWIHQYNEMYSGGGANIQLADFYELKQEGNTQAFIHGYPFYVDSFTRACFSENDYKKAQDNCHDELLLTVDIRFVKPMLWQFNYTYNASLSPVSGQTPPLKNRLTMTIKLDQPPKRLTFPNDWNIGVNY